MDLEVCLPDPYLVTTNVLKKHEMIFNMVYYQRNAILNIKPFRGVSPMIVFVQDVFDVLLLQIRYDFILVKRWHGLIDHVEPDRAGCIQKIVPAGFRGQGQKAVFCLKALFKIFSGFDIALGDERRIRQVEWEPIEAGPVGPRKGEYQIPPDKQYAKRGKKCSMETVVLKIWQQVVPRGNKDAQYEYGG